jgi:hypothetical protein
MLIFFGSGAGIKEEIGGGITFHAAVIITRV